MCLSATDVVALSNNGIVIYDDSTYHRIRSCVTESVVCQLQTTGNIFFIFCHNSLV